MDAPTPDRPSATAPTWDGARYDDRHAYVWRHGARLLELLAARPGERVLDLGCGTGHLTAEIAASGTSAEGIDSAPGMIERARGSYPGIRFDVADGHDFRLPEPVDAVFSNAALHWMTDPERVAASVRRALRPGGRFVGEMGGKGNVGQIVAALVASLEAAGYADAAAQNPWYFPSLGEYAALLERHGFAVRLAELFPRPTPLDGGEQGLRHWVETFGGSFLALVPDEEREDVLSDVEARLRPALYREGEWTADYRRLRFVALAQ